MSSLFITGASGFIGSNLLRRIDLQKFEKVYCLVRTRPTEKVPEVFEFIEGCICDTDSYSSYLNSCETVIHLAAATGKSQPEEYFKVNSKGTQLLIEQCQQSRVKNFLYVSTIAAKYVDKSRYYYAQSKAQGESAVINSGLNYAIVRPTIVIGKEAVIWQSLSKLAKKPVLLMLGDGSARIQPIYIEDLVDCLLRILDSNYFSNEVFELGGPEQITFENLLKRIHHLYHAKDPSVVHIPLRFLMATLSFLEKWFYSALPINVGQLSAFNNDGTIEMNRLFRVAAPQMRNVDSMLEQVMPSTSTKSLSGSLEQECQVFSQYLIGKMPSRYVVDKYCEAHSKGNFLKGVRTNSFDSLLLRLALANPLLAKLVDSYTGIFFKKATVRNKWILMLAILESCAPTYSYFDSPDSSKRWLLLARMTGQGIHFVICLCLSTLALSPLRLLLSLYEKFRGRN